MLWASHVHAGCARMVTTRSGRVSRVPVKLEDLDFDFEDDAAEDMDTTDTPQSQPQFRRVASYKCSDVEQLATAAPASLRRTSHLLVDHVCVYCAVSQQLLQGQRRQQRPASASARLPGKISKQSMRPGTRIPSISARRRHSSFSASGRCAPACLPLPDQCLTAAHV